MAQANEQYLNYDVRESSLSGETNDAVVVNKKMIHQQFLQWKQSF